MAAKKKFRKDPALLEPVAETITKIIPPEGFHDGEEEEDEGSLS